MSYDRGGKPVQTPKEEGGDEAMPNPAGGVKIPKMTAPRRARAPGEMGAAGSDARPAAAPTPVPLTSRLRVLPLMIFLAALLLSVKVSSIWDAVQGPNAVISIATYAEAQPAKGASATSSSAGAATSNASKADTKRSKRLQLAQATTTESSDEKPLDPVLFTRSEIELLQELSKRRKELDARERTVIQREGLLNAAETRIEKKIAELSGVKDDIELLIKKYDEQEEEQLDELVSIYEKMKPKDAARIFNELDIMILLEIFDKMKASKSAPILAGMKAERAKEITSRIAARREMPNIN